MQVSMTTQSDESSESLALYTLVQLRGHVTGNEEGGRGVPPILGSRLCGSGFYVWGIPPYLPSSETEKKDSEWDKLLFF